MATAKQRREAQRRRLERQMQRRRQREAGRKRLTLIASVVGTVAVIAIVIGFIIGTGNDKTPAAASKSSPSNTATLTPSATASTTTPRVPGACTFKPSGAAARKVAVPAAKAPTSGTVDVAIRTSQGAMTFALNRATAPCAVANFVSLAQQKYFDATPCHRLTTSGIFVLQCGDPTGSGKGGPGYSFNDELTGKEKYTRGLLAMANSGPDTNGSQFFIVYKDSTLGPNYTVFGSVKTGLAVVDKVAAKGSPNGDGKPKLAITIQQASVLK